MDQREQRSERGDQRGRLERRDQRGRSEREALGVWLGPLFIEPSHVTRSELVEGKLSKSRNFDKVSGPSCFGQKKKV